MPSDASSLPALRQSVEARCPKRDGNRIGVRFAYEFYDNSTDWYRSYGN
ncbi:DUF1348 family protein [Streptomyces canus]